MFSVSKNENIINDNSCATTSGDIAISSKNIGELVNNTNAGSVINDSSINTKFGNISIKNVTLNSSEYSRESDEMKPIVFGVVKPVSCFIGRESELNDIHAKLQLTTTDSGVISRAVAIVGMGGMGKTEITKKYADLQKDHYKHLIWINAEKRENLNESFANLYNCFLPRVNSDELLRDVKYYAEYLYKIIGFEDNALVIFDNVEHFENIMDFVPKVGPRPHKISTLINSRCRDWEIAEWGKIEIVKLNEFTQNEAVSYVKSRLNLPENDEDVSKLIKEMQALPLGLKHAVGYINNENKDIRYTKDTFKIDDYLAKYNFETIGTLDKCNANDFYGKTIFKTLDITMSKILCHAEYGNCARLMMNLFAYFYPLIDKDIFLYGFTKIVDVDLEKAKGALEYLEMYSMINIEAAQEWGEKKLFMSIHRLVQHVVRANLKNIKKEENVLIAALKMTSILYYRHKCTMIIKNHVISVWNFAIEYDNLTKKFYPITKYGFENYSPLHFLAANQSENLKKMVKNKIIDLNCSDTESRTPLHQAIVNGYLETIQILLDNGGVLNVLSGDIRKLVKKYIIVNNTNEIQRDLLYYHNVDASESYHLTDHNGTIQATIFDCDKYMLIYTATLDEDCYLLIDDLINNTYETWTTLRRNGKHRNKSICKVIFKKMHFICNCGFICLRAKKKVDVNQNKQRKLNLAAFEGHINVVKYFVKCGEDPIELDDNGQTVLHIAVMKNHMDIVKYLIEEVHVDVNIKNTMGETPLHVAVPSRSEWEMVKYLIHKGADVNAEDELGLTPVFAFVYSRPTNFNPASIDVLQYFLSLGVNLTCSPNSLLGRLGITLLSFSVLCRNKECFQVLNRENVITSPDEIKCEMFYRSIEATFKRFCNNALDKFEDSDSFSISTLNLDKNLLTNYWTCCKNIYRQDRIITASNSIVKVFEKFINLENEIFTKKILNFMKTNKNAFEVYKNRMFDIDNNFNFKFETERKSPRLTKFRNFELPPYFDHDCVSVEDRRFNSKSESAFDAVNNSFRVKNRPSLPVMTFVGRENTLYKMHECILGGRKVVISGSAGVGKSEVSRKYAQLYKNSYDNIFWIDAKTRWGIVETFKGLHDENELSKKRYLKMFERSYDFENLLCLDQNPFDVNRYVPLKCLIGKVHHKFGSLGRTLFIFDGAENFKSIEDFLPENGSSYVLINSRNTDWKVSDRTEVMELTGFTEEEARNYIKKEMKRLEKPEDVKELIDVLGCHPLVLKQATGFIKQMRESNESFGILQYLETFEKYKSQSRRESSSYHYKVAITWKIIFDYIQKDLKDVENFKMLIYLINDTKLITADLSPEQKDNFNLLSEYTSFKAFADMNKLYLTEQGQEEDILQKILQMFKNCIRTLSIHLIAFTYDICTRTINYPSLFGKLNDSPLSNVDFIPIRSFIINWDSSSLQKVLDSCENGNMLNFNTCLLETLQFSIKYGFLRGFQMLLDWGVDVNFNKNKTHLLVHYAAANGYKDIVFHLKENVKMPTNITDKEGFTPVMLAAYFGHLDVVEILTDDEEIQILAKLCQAVNEDNEERFISAMEQFERVTSSLTKSISCQVLVEDDASFLKFFLLNRDEEEDLYINLFARPYTSLHSASFEGNLNAVKSLMEGKHNEYEVDNDGNTALHYAVLNGHLQVVQFFVDELKMEINFRNFMGTTPLHLAALIGHIEIVKFLLEKGGDVNVEDELGANPEFYAAFGDNADVVQLLMNNRSKRNIFSGIYGFVSNALGLGIESHNEPPVSFLQDLNITPLHVALIFDNLNIAKMFIETKGFNNYRCEEVKLLLCFAESFKSKIVLPYLIGVGVVPDPTDIVYDVKDFMKHFKRHPKFSSSICNFKLCVLNIISILKLQKNESDQYLTALTTVENFFKNIM